MKQNMFLSALVLSAMLTLGLIVFAQEYNEAPMLAEQVQNGELPPVEERLPAEPYVVEPREEIGQYGGTARTAIQWGDHLGDDMLMMSLFNGLVQPNPETGELEPHFAREIAVSDDFSTYTIHFREGVKWSDGELFTAEDVMFWYEDVLLNPELTPVIPQAWRQGDEVAQVEALDDTTIRVSFAGPEPFFQQRLVHTSGWWFYPKHYLEEFHPTYVDEEALNRRVREAGFEEWPQLFGQMNSRWAEAPLQVGRPTLSSYVLAAKTADYRIYERNPYYWKIDSEGNQLPYIDRIEAEIVADREVMNRMIIAGEVDFAGYDTEVQNIPLYRRYAEPADYRVLLWQSGLGSDVIYQLNLTHEDEGLREIFQDVRFRRALSLAIDREEISELIYFGQAEPVQYTVLPISRYYRPEYAESHIAYDPDGARELFDEMGLGTDDAGYRLRPDGERISFTIEYVDLETPKGPNIELVAESWHEVGIDVGIRRISGGLQEQRAPDNLMDATIWHGDKATDILFPINAQFFVPIAPSWEVAWSTEWAQWFQTNGSEGMEPPDEVKELRGWWEEILISDSEERIVELADNILTSQAENLWVIGTVGRAPHPVIARNTLGNVPETGYWVWDMLWSASWHPEQMFFRE